jgi:hypothetical protein
MVLCELGNSMNDLTVSLFVCGSVWLVLLAAGRPPGLRRALAAAALLGAGVGGKLTAAVFAPGLLAMVALIPGRLAARAWRVGLAGLALAAGFLAVNGHNCWALYRRYGNPAFPFFNGYFRSPYFPLVNFRDPRWGPRTAYERWLYPYCVVRDPSRACEVAFRDYRFVIIQALLALALAALALRCCRRLLARGPAARVPPGVWSLVAFTAVSYVVWMLQFGIQRYIAALELLAPAAILCLFVAAFRANWLAAAGTLGCSVALALTMRHPVFDRAPWGDDPEYIHIERPAIDRKAPTLVLVTHPAYPHAYLRARFPKNVSYVWYHCWIFNTRLEQDIAGLVRAHAGPIYHLTMEAAPEPAAPDSLRRLGLAHQPAAGVPVRGCNGERFTLRPLTGLTPQPAPAPVAALAEPRPGG